MRALVLMLVVLGGPMRLTDLHPRCVTDSQPANAERCLGLSFECPHCHTQRLVVFFANPADGGASANVDQPKWHREGTGWADLTLTPSVDASKSGHWHGFITGGEIR